jgi:hypothetical protein
MKRINLFSFASLFAFASLSSGMVPSDGGGAAVVEPTPEEPTATTAKAGDVVATGAVQPNLSAEEKAVFHGTIKATFDNKVDVLETAFHFRKQVDAKTKVETKRNSVVLPMPVPSIEGIIAIIEKGGAGLVLLQEAVRDVLVETAREYIDANEDVTSNNFPYELLSWEAIANLPKADRRGGGIAKEVWADFAKDYIAVMPALINKSEEAVTTATKIFLTKFSSCKTNKPVLNKLKDYLAIYISNTSRGEEFAEAVDWLDKKIKTLIETGEQSLLNAL